MLGVSAVVRPQPTVQKSIAVIDAALPSLTALKMLLTPTHLLEMKTFAYPSSSLRKVGLTDAAHTKANAFVAELDR